MFFFFNDTATTEIYTLSLHDALPISSNCWAWPRAATSGSRPTTPHPKRDRKSTRLNSSHLVISYAVFCLKKKKNKHAEYLWYDSINVTQSMQPQLCGRQLSMQLTYQA